MVIGPNVVDDCEGMTEEDSGAEWTKPCRIHITRERVRQILAKAKK